MNIFLQDSINVRVVGLGEQNVKLINSGKKRNEYKDYTEKNNKK